MNPPGYGYDAWQRDCLFQRAEWFLEGIVNPKTVSLYLSEVFPMYTMEMWKAFYLEWIDAEGEPRGYPEWSVAISERLSHTLVEQCVDARKKVGASLKKTELGRELCDKYGVYTREGWTELARRSQHYTWVVESDSEQEEETSGTSLDPAESIHSSAGEGGGQGVGASRRKSGSKTLNQLALPPGCTVSPMQPRERKQVQRADQTWRLKGQHWSSMMIPYKTRAPKIWASARPIDTGDEKIGGYARAELVEKLDKIQEGILARKLTVDLAAESLARKSTVADVAFWKQQIVDFVSKRERSNRGPIPRG